MVGSGAGGATIAKELQGKFAVTVLEEGTAFKPFPVNLEALGKLRRTGLFFDEREIQLLFPAMKIQKEDNSIVMVRGKGLGGTTTLSAGNGLRLDTGLKKIGINLDNEFDELYEEIPITDHHEDKWSDTSKRLYQISNDMGLNPQPLPKLGNYQNCVKCGRCVLGCRFGVKWDSRRFLENAVDNGAKLVTGCKVTQIIIENKRVKGVMARMGLRSVFYSADMVILAAGGFSTPVILQNSGIACKNSLFVDPVLCVAAKWENSYQNKEISMAFAIQREHYILSPYFDYLSFFFNKKWRYPAKDTLSLMIKLADSNSGSIAGKSIHKPLTIFDKEQLSDGVAVCTQILKNFGVKKDDVFLGTINAGHPGGTFPLTETEAESFHSIRLPHNLYIADATLFNQSLGNPPILTIMAMAKRVGKVVASCL